MSTTDPDENGPTKAAAGAGSRVLKYLTCVVAVLGGAWVVSLVWLVLLAKGETATPRAATPARNDYLLYLPDDAHLVARFDIAKARRSPLVARLVPVGLGNTAEIFAALSGNGQWGVVVRTTDDQPLAEMLAKYDAEGPRVIEGFEAAAVRIGRERLHVAKTAAGTYFLTMDKRLLEATVKRVAEGKLPTLDPRLKGVLDCLSVHDHYIAHAGVELWWPPRLLLGELSHLDYRAAGIGVSARHTLSLGAVVSFGRTAEAEWFGREMKKRLADRIPEPAREPDVGWGPRARRHHPLLSTTRRLVDSLARSVAIRTGGPFTTFSVRANVEQARRLVALLELATGEAWYETLRRLGMF